MKKMLLALSLITTSISMITLASWEFAVTAAIDVLGGIHDCQCRQIARDIDCTLHDIVHEIRYVAGKFAYEDEPLVHAIESRLRDIEYAWLPSISHHARTYFVSSSDLQSVHATVQNMFYVWRHCQPQRGRCYDYELRAIERILYDAQCVVHQVRYGTCCCQGDFLWRLAKAFDDATHSIRRI